MPEAHTSSEPLVQFGKDFLPSCLADYPRCCRVLLSYRFSFGVSLDEGEFFLSAIVRRSAARLDIIVVISSVTPSFRPVCSILAINCSIAISSSFELSINVSAKQVCLSNPSSLQYPANPCRRVVIERCDIPCDFSDVILSYAIYFKCLPYPETISAFSQVLV